MVKKLSIAVLGALVVLSACTDYPSGVTGPIDVAAAYTGAENPEGESGGGITPTAHPGNISGNGSQVCRALGFTGEGVVGVKVDPPVAFSNTFVSTTLSADGRYLDWEITGARMLAVLVKGGPNFHVYDYAEVNLASDEGLHSPKQGANIPQISHYNLCYVPNPGEGEGCTPGYWRNHHDRWVGAEPADDFDATFGVDLFDPAVTLGWAIAAGGGGVNAFARHATAALLNAYAAELGSDGQFVDYPYDVDEVIQMVQDAVADDTLEETKDVLSAANELGCPLSGSRAER
jgi:hypothetical protein